MILKPFYKEIGDLTSKSHLKEARQSTDEVSLLPKLQIHPLNLNAL